MIDRNENIRKIRAFWNSRANLGIYAGTKDIILKKLEIEAISLYVRKGMRIFDIGCGNGMTAIELAKRYDVNIIGIDYAEAMITAARYMVENQNLKGHIEFHIGDVCNIHNITNKFDIIYTERTLINLPDWLTQSQAISDIISLLVEGGVYIMCESSQEGLNKVNSLRLHIGLSEIIPPWHNRYLSDSEVNKLSITGVKLENVIDFSSTYYFLSRIVNAYLAAQEGKEPEYESPINELALKLPVFGNIGQSKIWLWRKIKESKSGISNL